MENKKKFVFCALCGEEFPPVAMYKCECKNCSELICSSCFAIHLYCKIYHKFQFAEPD